MKRVFVFLLGFSFNLCAQNESCLERVEAFIKSVKPHASINLVPYFSDEENKWGYFDKVSGEILTAPIMRDAQFFKPNLVFYYEFASDGMDNGCDGLILGSEENYTVERIASSDYGVYEEYVQDEPQIDYADMVREDVAGFTVTADGRIISFNPRFYDAQKKKPLIKMWAWKFKNTHYTILTTQEEAGYRYSIIDEHGNSFKNFERLASYPNLVYYFKDSDDLWFYHEVEEGKFQFQSLLLNKSLKGLYDRPINMDAYANTLGYAIVKIYGKRGVLDLTNMTWKIKPQKKNDFIYLHYASADILSKDYVRQFGGVKYNGEIPTDVITQNRAKAQVYIQNSNHNFLQLDKKMIKPKVKK